MECAMYDPLSYRVWNLSPLSEGLGIYDQPLCEPNQQKLYLTESGIPWNQNMLSVILQLDNQFNFKKKWNFKIGMWVHVASLEADRLCQNITYISTKYSGFRVSLPLLMTNNEHPKYI